MNLQQKERLKDEIIGSEKTRYILLNLLLLIPDSVIKKFKIGKEENYANICSIYS